MTPHCIMNSPNAPAGLGQAHRVPRRHLGLSVLDALTTTVRLAIPLLAMGRPSLVPVSSGEETTMHAPCL